MDRQLLIVGGTSLTYGAKDADAWSKAGIALSEERIARIGPEISRADMSGAAVFDANGLLILPGIVDIHGDAFERQIQPRPETVFSHDIALADTDRQLLANGITTACHGVTYSWEGGLRGREAALQMIEQVEAQRAFALVDHRIHLRFECHHINGLQDALGWIDEGRVDIVVFNEHLPSIARKCARPEKLAAYAERARCDIETFRCRLQDAQAGSGQVQQVIAAIAAACRARGIPMGSHDDETCADRERFHEIGAGISEFPRTQDALLSAMTYGNRTIMGAPNVLLGGSHCGGLAAIDAVKSRMCDILASDYYYPSLLHAPFKLAFHGACSLADAWRLVSENPADALRLGDRGRLADGARADLVLVAPQPGGKARLIATIAAGKLAYCAKPERIVMRRAQRFAA